MGVIDTALSKAIREPHPLSRAETPLSDQQRESVDMLIRFYADRLKWLCEEAGYRANLVIDPDGAKS